MEQECGETGRIGAQGEWRPRVAVCAAGQPALMPQSTWIHTPESLVHSQCMQPRTNLEKRKKNSFRHRQRSIAGENVAKSRLRTSFERLQFPILNFSQPQTAANRLRPFHLVCPG